MVYIGLLAAAGIFAGELWIKNQVETEWKAGEEKKKLGGRLLLRKYHNKGAFLNIGQRAGGAVAVLSVILTAAVLALFFISFGRRGNGALKAGLTLLLGGAFSNTYDRLKRKYVVDYFSLGVKWKPLARIVFNLSDLCIMAGALTAALAGAGD